MNNAIDTGVASIVTTALVIPQVRPIFVDAHTFNTVARCNSCFKSNEGFLPQQHPSPNIAISANWIWSVDAILLSTHPRTLSVTRIYNKGVPQCFNCIERGYDNLPKDIVAFLHYAPRLSSHDPVDRTLGSCVRCKSKILAENRLVFKVSHYRDEAPWSWDGICDGCALAVITKQRASDKLLAREIADMLNLDELNRVLRMGWRIEGDGTRYFQD